MEPLTFLSLAKSVYGVLKKLFAKLYYAIRRKQSLNLLVSHERIMASGVWTIGLKYALTETDLEQVPSVNSFEQGEWLLAEKNGTLFGTRCDKFILANGEIG